MWNERKDDGRVEGSRQRRRKGERKEGRMEGREEAELLKQSPQGFLGVQKAPWTSGFRLRLPPADGPQRPSGSQAEKLWSQECLLLGGKEAHCIHLSSSPRNPLPAPAPDPTSAALWSPSDPRRWSHGPEASLFQTKYSLTPESFIYSANEF